MTARLRLDQAMVARGLAPSRSRARDAVKRGCVRLDGATVADPARLVAPEAAIAVDDPAGSYVSRAALKLVAGLDAFGFDPAGKLCLDLGASTGGFTQVLLERAAARVVAVDVGHGQFAPQIAADPRVTAIEGLNARDLAAAHLPAPPHLVTADLSFISLRLALPPALALAAPGAGGVFLVKPQFEVGRAGLSKGGLVTDPVLAAAAVEDVAGMVAASGWIVVGMAPSPIRGGDGNAETLLGAWKAA